MRDEVHVGDRRARGDNLRATYDKTVVPLFFDMDEYVGDFVRREVSIDGRMDDGMIPIQYLFLRLATPSPCIVLKWRVEVSVGAECSQE